MFLQESNQSKFPAFAQLYPDQLWIEIDEATQNNAKEVSKSYSFPPLSHHVYLNEITRSCLIQQIAQELSDDDEELKFEVTPTTRGNYERDVAIWTFIGGSDLDIEIKSQNESFKKRLILIPIEYVPGGDSFSIPQEWVDLQNWLGHYYLFIHLDLEDNWLRVRGFTTHKLLKEKADYNPYNHKYEISTDDLIDDFSVLLLSLQLTPQAKQQSISEDHLIYASETMNVNSQEFLNEEEAKVILSEWKTYAFYPPRMAIDFAQWLRFIQTPNQLETLSRKITNSSNNKVVRILQEDEESFIEELRALPNPKQCFEELVTRFRLLHGWIDQEELKERISNILREILPSDNFQSTSSLLLQTRSSSNESTNIEKISAELTERYQEVLEKNLSPKNWLNEEIPNLVSGWQKKDTSIDEFEKELVINQETYILKLICLNQEENQWRFQLESKKGYPLPEGMELILLQEDKEVLEEKDKVNSESPSSLTIDVTPESGDGLNWKTKPLPDDYESEILWF